MDSEPFERSETGLRLFVRLTPKAGQDRLAGSAAGADGRLRVKAAVTAPPEKGRANAALIALLARRLGWPKSRFRVARGQASRDKTIEIAGEPELLAGRLRDRVLPRKDS